MAKVKRVSKPKNKGKVNEKALEAKDTIDYFTKTPVFKFTSVDPNKWVLWEWTSEELKLLIDCFKKMEQLSWYGIQKHTGLRLKMLDIDPPAYLSKDIDIYEIRVSKEQRIHGYINKNEFNIVWFDRDHTVCPERKVRRYG